MLSGDGLLAIKVMAAAAPVAGFAAVAHVRARRRAKRAHEVATATGATRNIVVEVPRSVDDAFAAVRFDLTPNLMGCLAAANSASLRGFETPDAVMMALDVDAVWTGVGMEKSATDEIQPQRTRVIATREVLVLRSSGPARESVKVRLKALLRAHRSTSEGEPLYCAADGEIRTAPARRLRVAEVSARKQFYWVRSGGSTADSSHKPS
ncbi:hypothetical protein QTH90_03265 [Variovorax sp. J2P1-59]|uniref:hypothetical protein n=1 Tax=Variovorax flavidus TaxID=3053501 RepID=UPI0025789446|nr:hypothetical protein [Variovorax sp. J2P1-59]MDM0073384.1 hypothetical protein [Variovorax sp. J2P1-59]